MNSLDTRQTLENKRVLITGAGGGLGRSHAVLMAERGADIIVQDVNSERAAETAQQVMETGRQASVLVSDIVDLDNFAVGSLRLVKLMFLSIMRVLGDWAGKSRKSRPRFSTRCSMSMSGAAFLPRRPFCLR